jgi:D-glycero-alpha-D-manno-heptose-7-phosphate kinase
MDDLIETAMENGAIAAKVCGAGGGGCIAFFCDEGRRGDVENTIRTRNGAEILKWQINTDGLTVNVR